MILIISFYWHHLEISEHASVHLFQSKFFLNCITYFLYCLNTAYRTNKVLPWLLGISLQTLISLSIIYRNHSLKMYLVTNGITGTVVWFHNTIIKSQKTMGWLCHHLSKYPRIRFLLCRTKICRWHSCSFSDIRCYEICPVLQNLNDHVQKSTTSLAFSYINIINTKTSSHNENLMKSHTVVYKSFSSPCLKVWLG